MDRATAALLRDLKQRRLLEDTLVLFGSEFGRLPTAPRVDDRDHNITGDSMFLAGAAGYHLTKFWSTTPHTGQPGWDSLKSAVLNFRISTSRAYWRLRSFSARLCSA